MSVSICFHAPCSYVSYLLGSPQASELQEGGPKLGAPVAMTFDFITQLRVSDSLYWDNLTQCLSPLA